MEILMKILVTRFVAAFAVSMLSIGTVCAQEKVELKNVKGEWIVSNDITIPEAREKAIAQAKLEAMREAGVPELISESNVLYKSEAKGGNSQELFESITSVDVSGEIARFNVNREEKKFNDVGNLAYTVWIDATVLIHKDAKDPSFSFDVDGIRETYRSLDPLQFQVKPWKDSYLMAFIVSGNDALLLYPNNIEKKDMLKGGENYKFPGKGLNYEVYTEQATEINYLILLLTRQDIPYQGGSTPNDVLNFLAKINPSQKSVKTYSFLIKKTKE